MTLCNEAMHHSPHADCDGFPKTVIKDNIITEGRVILDPIDPIEAVLIQIVETNRKKRADYAQDGNIFSNFEQAAFAAGTTAAQGIEYMIATKQARLVALRSNGREPANESVADTMLDRAVYSIISLAYAEREK